MTQPEASSRPAPSERRSRTEPPGANGRPSKPQELEAVLERYAGRRLAIFLKGYPDPDSIASALAHRYLAGQLGVDVDLIHFEQLSHHENRALVKRLEVELIPYSDELDLSEYAGACFVDTQTPELPIELPELPVVSLVDHHKSLGPVEAEFVDVREDAGSTCAIYCEYLAHGRLRLDASDPATAKVATALMYGIRSDTDDYLLARPIDFEAAAYLAPLVDKDLLRLVSAQSISAKSMDILQVALDRKIIKGNYMIAGVSFVREEDRDGIAEAADYLLRREGVDTVLVYGIVGADTIDGSLRTTSNTVDPDLWMKDLFGADRGGRYFGGGRSEKGGFQIPLGILARCSQRELLWKTVACTIEDVFFDKIGAARE